MPDPVIQRPSFLHSLSARLLVLTIFFVMLSEVLIYAPSIARFRKTYLEDHIAKALLASLALEATPDNMVSKELEKQLLSHAGAYGIVLRLPSRKILMLSSDMPPKVDVVYDLRKANFMDWLGEAFESLVQRQNRVMRVMGVPDMAPHTLVEIILDETPMRQEMYSYSTRILQLSIVISLITAGLVYVSLQWLMVRPMRRIIRNMAAFREAPEDVSRTIQPSRRADEIGVAQRELAVMQDEIRAALRQQSRLATLGGAVAKINHDLRNSLATAVLVSDRLADIDDPEVKQVTPRLFRAIDQAVRLCSETLYFAREGGPTPVKTRFELFDLVDEAGIEVAAEGFLPTTDRAAATWRNEVAADFIIEADRNQFFRVLSNLGSNACQAGADTVTIRATAEDDHIVIDVIDNGGGFSERALERLFHPFSGTTKDGGTGLGLVIVRDIMRAHGGDIAIQETGPQGTVLRLTLPAPAAHREAAE